MSLEVLSEEGQIVTMRTPHRDARDVYTDAAHTVHHRRPEHPRIDGIVVQHHPDDGATVPHAGHPRPDQHRLAKSRRRTHQCQWLTHLERLDQPSARHHAGRPREGGLPSGCSVRVGLALVVHDHLTPARIDGTGGAEFDSRHLWPAKLPLWRVSFPPDDGVGPIDLPPRWADEANSGATDQFGLYTNSCPPKAPLHLVTHCSLVSSGAGDAASPCCCECRRHRRTEFHP
jgi:hypothetical protein